MILCIGVVSIMLSDNALLMKRLTKFWMTATLEHAMVISLGWLQSKKSFALAISGLLSSNTVMRLLRNAHLVNTFILKSAPILLHYTLSLLLAHSPNGGLTSCIVSLPQLGGNGYIIIAIGYFTKCSEAMPTLWKLNPGVRTITLTKIDNSTCKLHTKETEYGAEH